MFTKRGLGSLFRFSGMILATWVTIEVASAAEPFVLTFLGVQGRHPAAKKELQQHTRQCELRR